MEFIKKYKVLLIASVVGLVLSIAVAADTPDMNAFQAFISIEIVILIVYFIVINRKKKAVMAAQAQEDARRVAEEAVKKDQERWDSLTPEEQMVELKKKELNQNAAMHQESLNVQQSTLNMQQMRYDSMKKCPKCGSTSISGNRKGETFFTGVLFSKTVYCTCMSCGNRWKAGKK